MSSPSRFIAGKRFMAVNRNNVRVSSSALRTQPSISWLACVISSKPASIISLAVDARAQQYPDEARFVYSPLAHETTLWQGREDDTTLRNYNLNDLRI